MSSKSEQVRLIIHDVNLTEIFHGDELYNEPGQYTLINVQATYDPRFGKIKIGDDNLDLDTCAICMRSVKTHEDFLKSHAQHGMINIYLLESQFFHLVDVLRTSEVLDFKLNFSAASLPDHTSIMRLRLGEVSLIHSGRVEPVALSKPLALPTKKIENLLFTIAVMLGAVFIRMLLVK